jgi:hypothetical protein
MQNRLGQSLIEDLLRDTALLWEEIYLPSIVQNNHWLVDLVEKLNSEPWPMGYVSYYH